MERMGWENKKAAIARKIAGKTETRQDEEEEKRKEEVRMSLSLRNTVPTLLAGFSAANDYSKPSSDPCYRRATPAGRRRPLAATLAPSEAGAKYKPKGVLILSGTYILLGITFHHVISLIYT